MLFIKHINLMHNKLSNLSAFISYFMHIASIASLCSQKEKKRAIAIAIAFMQHIIAIISRHISNSNCGSS
jgi:uncharacterized membrane protein